MIRWGTIRERYFGLNFYYLWLPILLRLAVVLPILYVVCHFLAKWW